MKFQKSSPAMTGVLQTDDKDPKKRKTLGKIALWLNESDNGKAPKFRGILETEKGKFKIWLWDKEEKGEESPSIFVNQERISSADTVTAFLRRAIFCGMHATNARLRRRDCRFRR